MLKGVVWPLLGGVVGLVEVVVEPVEGEHGEEGGGEEHPAEQLYLAGCQVLSPLALLPLRGWGRLGCTRGHPTRHFGV